MAEHLKYKRSRYDQEMPHSHVTRTSVTNLGYQEEEALAHRQTTSALPKRDDYEKGIDARKPCLCGLGITKAQTSLRI